VPKFCQSQVPRWEAIIHHHLKRDKVIPSTHPQIAEIKHNPNGCEALMLLVSPCHPSYTTNGVLIQSHPQQGRRTLEEHFHRCEFYYYSQRCYLSTTHNWKDEIHIIHFLDSCLHSNVLRMLYNQEKYVPALQYKFTCEHIVAALKEYIASPSFVLLGGRHAVTPTTISTSTGTTLAAARPSGTTRYCFSRPNGGGGTQRSGNTGCSPRDRNVRTIKASAEPSLLDDDSSIAPPEDMIVAKLNGECLGGCDKFHPPYKCPNLTGDVEHQKKTFASLSSKRRYLPVRAITTTGDDDNDVDLINLHDSDDQDSDTDQDFPWGRLFVLLVVLALVVIGVMLLSAETRIRPQQDCLPQHQLVQMKFLWHQRYRCPMSVILPLLTSGDDYPHRIPRFGEGLQARIPQIYMYFPHAVQNRLYP